MSGGSRAKKFQRGGHHPWGSEAHEIARGRGFELPRDIWISQEMASVVPEAVKQARNELAQRSRHYDGYQFRLICIRCDWVPRQRNRLRFLEGRGYVCIDYEACERRQWEA